LVGEEKFAEQRLKELPARTGEQARTTRQSIVIKERTITPVIPSKLAAQVDKSYNVYHDPPQELHCNTQKNVK
jgi:S-methylmethionine-dependent homocysteine/selenocysteine methylase